MIERKIEKITESPLEQGFLGEGHTAVAVIDGSRYAETDPFILLMDDRLDLPGGEPAGGPHPHAGFETITLVLEGNGHDWKTGSLELMTAGRGVIHSEEITTRQKLRILQFWLVLPPDKRWTEPFWQQILLEDVPTVKTETGGEIRVYSGGSNGLSSPLLNQTPFILADFTLMKDAQAEQHLPSSYQGFIYVLEGRVSVGGKSIEEDQLGWLDLPDADEESRVTFNALSEKTRFVFFAGKPHHAPVVHHGPFIGDSHEDILRLFKEYRSGAIPHLNDLPEKSKVRYAAGSK